MITPGRRWIAAAALVTMLNGQLGASLAHAAQTHEDDDTDHVATATPIKHVIILIGENRTFDNVYGTYVPRHGQTVWNLLSRGIVNADGSPGPNKDAAEQFKIGTINPPAYFISTNKLIAPNKTPYAPFLPTPEAGGAPPRAVTLAQLQKDPAPSAPPFDAHTFSMDQLHALSPVFVDPKDLRLLTTGATGLHNCTADPSEPPSPCAEPDTRIEDFDRLPQHGVSDHGTERPLRQLHRRHGAPLLPHVAAVGLRRDERQGGRSRRLPERPLSLRRHRAW